MLSAPSWTGYSRKLREMKPVASLNLHLRQQWPTLNLNLRLRGMRRCLLTKRVLHRVAHASSSKRSVRLKPALLRQHKNVPRRPARLHLRLAARVRISRAAQTHQPVLALCVTDPARAGPAAAARAAFLNALALPVLVLLRITSVRLVQA